MHVDKPWTGRGRTTVGTAQGETRHGRKVLYSSDSSTVSSQPLNRARPARRKYCVSWPDFRRRPRPSLPPAGPKERARKNACRRAIRVDSRPAIRHSFPAVGRTVAGPDQRRIIPDMSPTEVTKEGHRLVAGADCGVLRPGVLRQGAAIDEATLPAEHGRQCFSFFTLFPAAWASRESCAALPGHDDWQPLLPAVRRRFEHPSRYPRRGNGHGLDDSRRLARLTRCSGMIKFFRPKGS